MVTLPVEVFADIPYPAVIPVTPVFVIVTIPPLVDADIPTPLVTALTGKFW